jgi:hypothetical protein
LIIVYYLRDFLTFPELRDNFEILVDMLGRYGTLKMPTAFWEGHTSI